jgi:effector-binding domain-containing protein
MLTEPKLENRNKIHYAAIRTQVGIPFGAVLPALWGEVFAWLADKGIAQAGAPFIRYLTTDMARKLDLEVGIPVATHVPGDGRISTGVFPAGRYVVAVYSGPYEGLVSATAEFLDWAKQSHILWQTTLIDDVEWWEGRVEFYITDPAAEPDPQKWQTELAFLVADKQGQLKSAA